MPRFALLKHETPPGYPRPTHFDLLLEAGDVCRTWALEQVPHANQTIRAEALDDHRLLYLDYEGELSDGRGSVSRVDWGTCEWMTDHGDHCVVRLAGGHLAGILTLTMLPGSDKHWECQLTAD